jgi:hypothetical protein
MKRILLLCVALAFVGMMMPTTTTTAQQQQPKKTAKEGLQDLHDLIGTWKCTGNPTVGTKEERDKFWQEKIAWQWQFKDKDVWLSADLSKGKYYSKFLVRYLPQSDAYKLEATTAADSSKTLEFSGKLERRKLTFERTDDKTRQNQRLVFSLLHHNRYVLTYEERQPEARSFQQLYKVGSTKEGVPFATVDKGPECVVSGGLGTMTVVHKGKTYYVCCSGCRDAFRDDPEKYVREFEESKKKEKKD